MLGEVLNSYTLKGKKCLFATRVNLFENLKRLRNIINVWAVWKSVRAFDLCVQITISIIKLQYKQFALFHTENRILSKPIELWPMATDQIYMSFKTRDSVNMNFTEMFQ